MAAVSANTLLRPSSSHATCCTVLVLHVPWHYHSALLGLPWHCYCATLPCYCQNDFNTRISPSLVGPESKHILALKNSNTFAGAY